jgi:glycerophosphoryl diester phosphodiesterase
VDIQLSKDQQPVLFHDRSLQRLANDEHPVHQLEWSALQKLTLIQSLKIPHLDELVRYIQSTTDVLFFIEVKRISLVAFGVPTVVDIILEALKPVSHQCVIISYSLDALHYVRQSSEWPIGVVVDNWAEHNKQDILQLKAEYFFCGLESLPQGENVKLELKLKKSKLVVFETIDVKVANELLQRGVDLVETFSIGAMIKACAT